MKVLLSLIGSALVAAGPAFAQDAVKGKAIFSRCIGCHAVGEKANDGVGPQLNGIVGSPIGGHSPTYAYSPALKAAGEAGGVWSEEKLTQWVISPRKTIPGNKMTFVGLTGDRVQEDAKDLVAYLKTLAR